MSTNALIEAWGPAIVGFAVMSAAIYALMEAYKKAVKGTKFAASGWYKRTLPFIPSIMGACAAPFVGPSLTPVELSLAVHVGAGILQGSLGVHFYTMWKHAISSADEQIQVTISNLGDEESDALDEENTPE